MLSDIAAFTVVLFPPLQWLLDGVTAVLLFVALGFRWSLFAALAVEAVPGLQLFPAWTLVVVALATTEARSASDAIDVVKPAADDETTQRQRTDRKIT